MKGMYRQISVPRNMDAYLSQRMSQKECEKSLMEKELFRLAVFMIPALATVILWFVGCR